MTINKIYFDMDGVLANFDKGVRDLSGKEPIDQANVAPGEDEDMWAGVRSVPNFYNKLEPMPGALNMFFTLYNKYGDKCQILTGIPKPHRGVQNAKEDKIRWAHRILSEELVVNVVYKEEKKNFCTGPGDVLIDDYVVNINSWIERGGTGILFSGAEDVLKKIEEMEARPDNRRR